MIIKVALNHNYRHENRTRNRTKSYSLRNHEDSRRKQVRCGLALDQQWIKEMFFYDSLNKHLNWILLYNFTIVCKKSCCIHCVCHFDVSKRIKLRETQLTIKTKTPRIFTLINKNVKMGRIKNYTKPSKLFTLWAWKIDFHSMY